MPIQLNEENSGNVLEVHVSGMLAKADYDQFVPEFERLVEQHGKLRVLFNMTSFQGWDAGARWADTKFAIHHFGDIERLAMVGEKKWQQGVATFCKPFTKATIQYFDRADAAEAREWLDEAAAASVNTKAECTMKSSVTDETGPLAMDINSEIVNPQFHYHNRRVTHA